MSALTSPFPGTFDYVLIVIVLVIGLAAAAKHIPF